MRQLATLPSADAAQTLADYFLTLHINTKVEQQPEGWAIWVRDEDQLPQARQELDAFNRNPHDPRFTESTRAAEKLRREKRNLENAYHRRQERFQSRMGAATATGKCTLALIVISVLVSLLSRNGHSIPWVQALSIAPPYRMVPVGVGPSGPTSDDEEESFVWVINPPGLTLILHGEIWRLVTPIFLHFPIWHLLFNMSWLYILGGAIERRRGPFRYLALVVVVAISSNLTQYFLGHATWDRFVPHPVPSSNFGGMSGVVYGLFGYVWMKARFHPELGLHIDATNIIIMMAWFFLCMTPLIHYVIGSNVANAAHAAGLIAGMLIGYVPTLWHSFRSE